MVHSNKKNQKNKNNMKIIFLDHDGVICLASQWGGRSKKRRNYIAEHGNVMSDMEMPCEFRFDDFDSKAISVLNNILEETGAEIVVSSDWKNWATLEEMGQYYEKQGIIKKPIGYTTSILKGDLKFHNYFTNLEETRSYEILEYIDTHPEITHWVSIDDLNMSERIDEDTNEYFWGLKNFVWTPYENEGIKQSGVKENVIEFLVD